MTEHSFGKEGAAENCIKVMVEGGKKTKFNQAAKKITIEGKLAVRANPKGGWQKEKRRRRIEAFHCFRYSWVFSRREKREKEKINSLKGIQYIAPETHQEYENRVRRFDRGSVKGMWPGAARYKLCGETGWDFCSKEIRVREFLPSLVKRRKKGNQGRTGSHKHRFFKPKISCGRKRRFRSVRLYPFRHGKITKEAVRVKASIFQN